MDNDILVVNVDEVYHGGVEVPLQGPLRMELNHLTGLGYAKASDILRLLVLDDFGGAYTDGDNRSTVRRLWTRTSTTSCRAGVSPSTGTTREGQQLCLHRGPGPPVHPGHDPACRAQLRQDPSTADGAPRTGSSRQRPFVTEARTAGRFSPVNRTGPYNLWWGGFGVVARRILWPCPRYTALSIESAASWQPQ